MNLGPNFTLTSMLHSAKADELGITAQYNPPKDVLDNLQVLVTKCLQPLRDKLGKPINISSGYRCPDVNKAIGGVSNSQHQFGQAADTEVNGMTTEEWFQWVLASGIEFDQLIQEFNNWVHISYNEGHNRREIFRATMVDGKAVYTPVTHTSWPT